MKVVFISEIEEDLYQLIKVLVEKECLGAYPSTIFYVEELVADIWQNIHSKQKKASRFYNHVSSLYILVYFNEHTYHGDSHVFMGPILLLSEKRRYWFYFLFE